MGTIQYNEKIRHGTADFPIEYYYVDSTHPRYVMPLHWHDVFEILRVVRGEFELYIDNRAVTLSAGQTALIPCTAMHRGTPFECEYECLLFSIGMLRKRSNDIVSKFLRPIEHSYAEIAECIDKQSAPITVAAIDGLFDAVTTEGEYYELTVHRLLYAFFEGLYAEGLIHISEDKPKKGRRLQVMTELIGWIDENYTENITLKDLSRVAGLNEKYLCRFFKEYTGRTPVDYVNALRIEAACKEMAQGMSVTTAALESGFNSLSYFTRTFKRYKNMSPNQYIKSL